MKMRSVFQGNLQLHWQGRETMAGFRVAVIGASGRGNYGHGLDAVWGKRSDCELVGLADADPAGRAAAAKRLQVSRTFSDYRRMLEEIRPDIVAVCPRWADQHHAMMMACAESGCHMYVEKPFCRTPAEADEIIRACEMRHLKVAVAHISRWSPQLRMAARLIRQGEIGELVEMRARGKEDARGGGEDLWVLGTHVLDLMRMAGGEPRQCVGSMFQNGHAVTGADIVEGNEGLGPLAGDRVDASYVFDGGVMGYFSSRRLAGGAASRFGLRVFGTKGVIHMGSGYGNPAWLLSDPTWGSAASSARWLPISSRGIDMEETDPGRGYDGGNAAAAEDLIQCIRTDRQPICSMYEAAAAVEMVNAVFASHCAGGDRVSLPLQQRGNALAGLAR